MNEEKIYFELSDLKDQKHLKQLHKFWVAILSFNVLGFYELLNDSINLNGLTKQSFSEKLHRKISAHQLYGDEEYILVLNKEELNNSNALICDFMGCINTCFSTILKFELADNRVVGISFVEDKYDIKKVVDLYSFKEFKNHVIGNSINPRYWYRT